MPSVNFKPKGFHTVTPYLIVADVNKVISFLEAAFDARELLKMPGENGRIAHAEVQIGDSIIMMGEPTGKYDAMPSMLYLYLEDVDDAFQRAVNAGATENQQPADQFYGDRTAAVIGPQGNHWWMATHVKKMSEEELMAGGQPG